MQSEIVISLLEKIYSELIRLKARVKIIDEKIGVTTATATAATTTRRAALVDKPSSHPKENESCVRVIVFSNIDRRIHIADMM